LLIGVLWVGWSRKLQVPILPSCRTYFFRRLTANPAYYDQQAALLETPDFEKQKDLQGSSTHLYMARRVICFVYRGSKLYKLYDAFGGYLGILPLHSRSNGFAC